MTTKADERLTRIEEAIGRLEAIGPSADLLPTPTGVDASGWPTHVAAGELIESAWGNAVVDALTSMRTNVVMRQITANATMSNLHLNPVIPGLVLPAVAQRIGQSYRLTVVFYGGQQNGAGNADIRIVDGNTGAPIAGMQWTRAAGATPTGIVLTTIRTAVTAVPIVWSVAMGGSSTTTFDIFAGPTIPGQFTVELI